MINRRRKIKGQWGKGEEEEKEENKVVASLSDAENKGICSMS
jgi:hypothetical protein